MCGVSVAWYKLVAEKGSWGFDFIGDADRAWARGEENSAVLGWSVASEMGYEAAQNNVAFLLEKGIGEGLSGKANGSDSGLRQWVRSAAQDNVDAIVKVGDLYCKPSSLAKRSELRDGR
jgi:SEL1 protein